jgi:hypothetical protein
MFSTIYQYSRWIGLIGNYRNFILKFNYKFVINSVFLIGKISQKFDLKNVILTNTKDFSWEKWSKFAKFWRKKIQIVRFL